MTARWSSAQIGEREVSRAQIGTNTGLRDHRDSFSVHPQRVTESAVLGSEIQLLPPFEGYLCITGHQQPKEGATNRTDDVKIVQGLLNMQAVSRNHVDRLLELDGRMGRETLAAIVAFQRREGFAQTGIRPESSRHAMRPLASCAASVREP